MRYASRPLISEKVGRHRLLVHAHVARLCFWECCHSIGGGAEGTTGVLQYWISVIPWTVSPSINMPTSLASCPWCTTLRTGGHGGNARAAMPRAIATSEDRMAKPMLLEKNQTIMLGFPKMLEKYGKSYALQILAQTWQTSLRVVLSGHRALSQGS